MHVLGGEGWAVVVAAVVAAVAKGARRKECADVYFVDSAKCRGEGV